MNETIALKANRFLIVEDSNKIYQADVFDCLPSEGCRVLQMVALAPLKICLYSHPPPPASQSASPAP